jgi:hypothetical protein
MTVPSIWLETVTILLSITTEVSGRSRSDHGTHPVGTGSVARTLHRIGELANRIASVHILDSGWCYHPAQRVGDTHEVERNRQHDRNSPMDRNSRRGGAVGLERRHGIGTTRGSGARFASNSEISTLKTREDYEHHDFLVAIRTPRVRPTCASRRVGLRRVVGRLARLQCGQWA